MSYTQQLPRKKFTVTLVSRNVTERICVCMCVRFLRAYFRDFVCRMIRVRMCERSLFLSVSVAPQFTSLPSSFPLFSLLLFQITSTYALGPRVITPVLAISSCIDCLFCFFFSAVSNDSNVKFRVVWFFCSHRHR